MVGILAKNGLKSLSPTRIGRVSDRLGPMGWCAEFIVSSALDMSASVRLLYCWLVACCFMYSSFICSIISFVLDDNHCLHEGLGRDPVD